MTARHSFSGAHRFSIARGLEKIQSGQATGGSVSLGRPAGRAPLVPDALAEGITGNAEISDDPLRHVRHPAEQARRPQQLVRLAWGDPDGPDAGVGVHARLGTSAAARTAKRLTTISLPAVGPLISPCSGGGRTSSQWSNAKLWTVPFHRPDLFDQRLPNRSCCVAQTSHSYPSAVSSRGEHVPLTGPKLTQPR
jgi:hypothetical protein